MRTARSILFAAVAALLAPVAVAASFTLAPYKDELFAYPKVLDSQYGGDFLLVEYSHQRDMVDRDATERVKALPKYVSLEETQPVEADLVLDAGSMTVKYVGVGKTGGGAKTVVIFVHGSGVDRFVAMSDWGYGGNFNRLKNLMVRNGGVYLSPDFSDFKAKGAAQIKALLLHEAAISPGAPIVLACASLGGNICWRLANDPETAPLLGGMIFLDSVMSEGYLKGAAEKRIPIYASNGDEDKIVGSKKQVSFFRKLKEIDPSYPIKFVLWHHGGHKTSLRMLDWREALNWMLAVRGD